MTKPLLDTLASRISLIHELSGLTCSEMSDLAGLPSRGHVGMLIRGDVSRPASETLIKIAQAFGVSIEWLLVGEGTPPTIRSIQAAIHAAPSSAPANDPPPSSPRRKPRRSRAAA